MSWGTNVLVGQSGGPTAVINSSLAGVYEAAKALGAAHVYGMEYGIQGLLQGKIVDLDDRLDDKMEIELLKRTPSSYLGSCRFKLPNPATDERPFVQLFELFAKYCIGAVFYIGGNDSMDTIAKLSAYGAAKGSEIRFIGVPKTIDNDLMYTDHTPGYGSAAKYIATILKEVICDSSVYNIRSVTVAEIMGRHTGWLALTRIRASLVSESALFQFAQEIDLGEYLRLGRGEERCGGRTRPSVVSDAFEAVIAALYLDGGMEVARKFILPFITEGKHAEADYKTRLQEIVQQNPEERLSYVVESESGPDHDKHFVVAVRFNSDRVARGEGRSKKAAEQCAAKEALKLLGVIKEK